MKSNKQTIEQIGGFVTVHVALPPHLLNWVIKRAKHEGHTDLSAIVRQAVDGLMAKHRAESASA
jgi:hypothetical protein